MREQTVTSDKEKEELLRQLRDYKLEIAALHDKVTYTPGGANTGY